ncbi:MAG: helix-turn-helix transcriptional regulator [Lachnospiraceae bacterium]|nr:helix-turn-helix transcriptional regulator [Lachnospiraceae bacterium]
MDIDTYLQQNKENMIPHNLPIHLELLLEQKGLTKADVVRGSQLNRKYVYQIFSGEKTPSRDKLIAIAFGLGLSDEQTQTMLKLSGNRELYVRDERDAIILFSLQRKKTIFETNELLYNHGFTVLGAPQE